MFSVTNLNSCAYIYCPLPSSLSSVFANDTVLGDPLFSVPLSFDSEDFQVLPMTMLARKTTPHLCFEIHGDAGSYFNFVSDTCTSVNALYAAVDSPTLTGFNVITNVGITAKDSSGRCVLIEIGVGNNCQPIVRSEDLDGDGELDPVNTTMYNSNSVHVSRRRTHVRVSVPNCGNTRLVMYASCSRLEDSNTLMMRFDITRGINLSPTSHGLIGKVYLILFYFYVHNNMYM